MYMRHLLKLQKKDPIRCTRDVKHGSFHELAQRMLFAPSRMIHSTNLSVRDCGDIDQEVEEQLSLDLAGGSFAGYGSGQSFVERTKLPFIEQIVSLLMFIGGCFTFCFRDWLCFQDSKSYERVIIQILGSQAVFWRNRGQYASLTVLAACILQICRLGTSLLVCTFPAPRS